MVGLARCMNLLRGRGVGIRGKVRRKRRASVCLLATIWLWNAQWGSAAERKDERVQVSPRETSRFDKFAVEVFPVGATAKPIPFHFFRESRILLPVMVNGVRASALLDSGADIVMISQGLAKRLGTRPTRSVMVAASGGALSAPVLEDLDIRLGAIRIHSIAAAVVDLNAPSQASGQQIDLILGREFFEHLVVHIDFDQRLISFHDPEEYQPPADSVSVPLRRFGRSRVVDVRLEERVAIPMQFDLGMDMPLMLSHPFWSKQSFIQSRLWSTTLFASAAGAREAPIGTLSSITLGGEQVSDLSVILAPLRAEGEHLLPPGIIGMPILSRFNLTTDYKNDVVYLKQRLIQAATPKDRAGLRLVWEGDKLRILLVARNSPAAAAGWAVGDLVVAVNEKGIGPDYWSSGHWRWTTAGSGTVVKFKMADGSQRTLILKDYF